MVNMMNWKLNFYIQINQPTSCINLQIYRTLVRPVVTYGSESWTLTVEEERALVVFERKILRKIYGPVKEKNNYGEFDKTMNYKP
jgi:hypothetical protein